MIFKKKKQQQIISTDFKTWEQDFGFLSVVINRKKELTKTFFFSVYSEQLNGNDHLTDKDVNDQIEKCVSEVLNTISESYKNFLVNKYFRDYEELIKFVTEDIYRDFVSHSVFLNNEKIKKINISNMTTLVDRLNK